MTMDAYAPAQSPPDLATAALSRLVSHITADALFALAGGGGIDSLEPMSKRRGEVYVAVLQGQRLHTMLESFDGWLVEMTRAMAPVAAPTFLPMADVLAEKVTLEAGARGLRGLFSSKPSEKDVQRVKRNGFLAARALRAVFAADGPMDAEERRNVAAFIGALGLPDADSSPLYSEVPVAASQLDVYGDLEPAVARALLRGAWLAAAWDSIDPREEETVRTVAQKISIPPQEVEALRSEAVARVDARRAAGLAAVEAVRYVLTDRVPGLGVQLASNVGLLMLPRRYRDEALAHVGHWTKVQLSQRHKDLPSEQKVLVLAVAWLCGLYEDPTVGRRALLRARHDRFAADLGEDGAKVRAAIDQWVSDVLAPAAYPMTADPK